MDSGAPTPANRPQTHAHKHPLRTFLAISLAGLISLGATSAVYPIFGNSTASDHRSDRFLEDLERRAFLFFIEHTDSHTGLTQDRAPRDGTASYAPASIAASGFALSAWCIGAERHWINRDEAIARTLTALRFIATTVEHEHGWIYHFIDLKTGKRVWQCEASTIDTALFLKGALLAREYFQHPEITELVNRLYARIDWRWALNGQATLTHGWTPESGFLHGRWDSYSELLGLYLLGLGAPANALPADTWHAWQRPIKRYANYSYIYCGPLFTHQFAHAWFDFRDKHDAYTNYWQNSVQATLAQREWCTDLSSRFPQWSNQLWGVTASDSATGYRAWGGPLDNAQDLDGTLVPCAAAGSIPFAPNECLETLQQMQLTAPTGLWTRYGFADAYNPQTGWVAPDVIAIDLGITLMMSENHRTGLIWKHFMHAPEVTTALKTAGFTHATSRLYAQSE